METKKIIIYSLLPRLWGNQTEHPQANGSLGVNGVGKLRDITDEDLLYIKSLGATHLWLIGLLDHSTATAFANKPADPAEIVKGIAGSPYSVRDYYGIAPELLEDGEDPFVVFEALLNRIHRAGLRLLIDFIPNHVARTYHSLWAPSAIGDFGREDDSSCAFSPQNNFYYFPNTPLQMPVSGQYTEYPARATGNDCFTPTPSIHDWYETVKLNYGVDYLGGQTSFYPIPNTWHRMLDILKYWLDKGVDGFRCDMAELVPSEFWAWVIPQLKEQYPQTLFLAEIYQPHLYPIYISAGFDYLYDKVGMYDTARAIITQQTPARYLDEARQATSCQEQMCYFLENHDEQRIASDFFASNPQVALPALASMLLCGTNPFLLYFGQEIGERGMDAEGFSGQDGRTTIFDYWALPSIQRLRKKTLEVNESLLLSTYQKLFGFVAHLPIISEGGYYGLNYANEGRSNFSSSTFAFLRYRTEEVLLVVANHSPEKIMQLIRIPQEVFDRGAIPTDQPWRCTELVSERKSLEALTPFAPVEVELPAYGISILLYQKL